MALDGQDERSTSTQREIDQQNQPDALQSQVTELQKAQDATPENPELFSEVQSLKEKLGKHSELLAQSAEKPPALDGGTTTGDSTEWKTQEYAMEDSDSEMDAEEETPTEATTTRLAPDPENSIEAINSACWKKYKWGIRKLKARRFASRKTRQKSARKRRREVSSNFQTSDNGILVALAAYHAQAANLTENRVAYLSKPTIGDDVTSRKQYFSFTELQSRVTFCFVVMPRNDKYLLTPLQWRLNSTFNVFIQYINTPPERSFDHGEFSKSELMFYFPETPRSWRLH
uniref:Uncharacterized protein n=1 Tax=Brassica campestris TaxID=3711 RepID=M4FGT2_BRACM|nr:unnamed protein product [Brassica rapa]